jgi:integrase
VDENPFAHIKGSVRGNTTRRRFVPGRDVLKVMNAAPDPQWKLLLALARWGGLRIPSEALALTWRDVNFEQGRFIIRSSKTEHHEDGGVRMVPMFPELVEHFQKVFDDAPEGTEHVISHFRNPAVNLRTQLVRYIEAAGLTAWPKPWQNLRSTRATELADQFPSHVCAAWLGHTEAIADEFYRTVTDEHFSRANGTAPAHNPAQQGAAGGSTDSQLIGAGSPKNSVLPVGAKSSEALQMAAVGDEGFEPPTPSV